MFGTGCKSDETEEIWLIVVIIKVMQSSYPRLERLRKKWDRVNVFLPWVTLSTVLLAGWIVLASTPRGTWCILEDDTVPSKNALTLHLHLRRIFTGDQYLSTSSTKKDIYIRI